MSSDVNHKKFSNGGIIVVEDDYDVIHFDNSSDLALSTSLNDLDFATLHIDGQSMDVDAPPDIIDVDEDDDIIDDEDALPHDLIDYDDEDLVNVDDDDDVAMSADVARGHDGDGSIDDRPHPHQIGGSCRGKGTRKPNLGGRKADRLNTHKKTRNLGLRKITYQFGPQVIRFEWSDRGTLMPLGDHMAHWANLLWEIFREFPMHFHSWHNIPEERKARFDLMPHMQFDLWPKIKKGIQQHLAKIYTDNKSSLKAEHWVANPDDGTYDCAQNAQNRAKSTVICQQGSRSLAVLRDRQMESSATREYPSLIQTYFDTHTVSGVFLRDEERLLYEMLRLQGLGTYTDDQIMAIVRRGKQRGHNPGVGKVLAGRSRDVLMSLEPRCTYTADSQHEVGSGSGSGGGGDDEPGNDEDAGEEEEDEEDEDS
ncbi:hypothetical protein Tco_0428207 [Tanacetum coccineum]